MAGLHLQHRIHWEDIVNEFKFPSKSTNILNEFTVIINCTPLGTYPKVDEAPPLPYKYLTQQHYLFDLVYNPPLTQFLSHGKQHNCIINNGYEMLIIQAEENWRMWNE